MAGLAAGSRLGLRTNIGFTYQDVGILGTLVRVRIRVTVTVRVRVMVRVRVEVRVRV